MFLLELSRVIKFAWQSFFRNIWLSVVTVIIIVLSLLSVSFLLMANIISDHLLTAVGQRTQVYIDLTAQSSTEQAKALISELQKLPAIKEAAMVSPEETLANFKKRHRAEPLILDSLAALKNNPFSGSILISVHRIADFPVILKELSRPDYKDFLEIDDQEFSEAKILVERISDYSAKIQRTWVGVSLVFLIISLLIVFNTVQVGIYTHREEIGIMKLVGASNSFIRGPFLVEGGLYSFISVVILMLLLYPFLLLLQPYVDSFLREYSLNLISALNQNFGRIFGVNLLIAAVITAVSSLLATRRYLKV